MPNPSFHIENLSFWLGFIAATLFWWLLRSVKPLLPRWWRRLRRLVETISSRNYAEAENYLKRQTILRAQSQHLAASLFSLDEILVTPRLLAPPTGQNPDEEEASHSIASMVVPYLPDWPELVASFGVPTITLLEALQSQRHIVVIGQPGSGKTVALAHLASQLSRRDPLSGSYQEAVVLFLHVLDIDTRLENGQDPIPSLIRSGCSSASAVMQPQISRFLQTVIRNDQRQIVLLLDGLDELPQQDLQTAVSYISALIKKIPRLQVVTTGSSDYIGGLTQINFYPLSLAAWSHLEQRSFAQKWGDLWMDQVMPEAQKNAGVHPIDANMMEFWLKDDAAPLSPLERTLRLWGAYAGDLSGNHAPDIVRSFITRFVSDPSGIPALESLAYTMLQNKSISMPIEDIEKCLTSPQGSVNSQPPQAFQQLDPGRRTELLKDLIAVGVFSQHTNNVLRFSNPVFLGILASAQISSEETSKWASSLEDEIPWTALSQVRRYVAACDNADEWINLLLEKPESPLYLNLLQISRWLKDAPQKSIWRNNVMRRLASLVSNDTLPLTIRARFIAALHLSGDPSTDKLFNQLLQKKSPTIRRLALLGCGASGNPHHTDSLLSLLADDQPEVRFTACLALAAIPHQTSLEAMREIMLSGDEAIRQAAAEALARDPESGHPVLVEASTHEDLLTRRAAVFGLMQVHESWAQKSLEKIAVEDGQWVVRNSAAQALQTLQNKPPVLPQQLPVPSEAGWLISFASKLGMGIQPGQPPVDILLMVLKTGTLKEQVSTLSYLREQPDEEIIRKIYSLVDYPDEGLSAAAVEALWWMALSGIHLPSIS